MTLRLLLVFCLFLHLTVYRYEKDATLSYGLRFTGEKEQNRERQVAVLPRHIAQGRRGSGNVFLTSRAYYTANGTSTSQLYRIILGGNVQTNPGPKNNKKSTTPENTITHHNALVCHCKILHKHIIVFSFSWELKWAQEKLKTMLMQNFGVTNKTHYHSMQMFLPFHWPRAHHVTCK